LWSSGADALGHLYENGLGVKQDFAEAAEWYRRAADQGGPESQNNPGVLCTTGQGVPQDYMEAVRLYGLAATQDDLEATTNLAFMYANGDIGRRDYVRAYVWFDLAAEEIRKAAPVRDDLAKQMTPAQLIEARRFAAQKRKELPGKEGRLQ